MTADVSALFAALSNFGAFGILVAFLIWKDLRSERSQSKSAEQALADKRLEDERRMSYDRERLDADKALAASLAGLTAAIQSRGK